MTFRFERIGPVDNAEITLGDLTIIAGRNNTGKTYLAYALYGFLKQWEGWPGASVFFRRHARDPTHPVTALKLPKIAKALAELDRASVQVTPAVLAEVRRRLVDQLARDFSAGALPAVFSTTSEALGDARVSVELNERDLEGESPAVEETAGLRAGRMTLRYNGRELAFAIDRGRATSTRDGSRMGFYLPGRKKEATSTRDGSRRILEGVMHHLLLRLFCCGFPRPFILSAERFGISLFYKELDFTKSQLVDLLQKMGRDDDRDSRTPFLLIDKNTSKYAQPIKDNIDYTRNIHDMQKEQSALAKNKLFNDVKNIMGGYYKASRDAISFRSKARGKRKFDIPLHLASSSARGLADLYFYLRHKAARGDLLIIDEPESHLDTGNQILLARILARFVRAGIKVLVTTHSDYLVKEINNLIMIGQLDNDSPALRGLKYANADQLTPSSVRAYVADGHKLAPATVDEFGIDMPVFDDTIDDINQVSRTLAAEVRARHNEA